MSELPVADKFAAFEELIPPLTDLNTPYREALSRGELILQQCQSCFSHQYPFESFCYECGSTELENKISLGQGFVYSFVKVHQPYHPAFKPFIPYTVATIQLDDGPRLLSAMLDLTTEVKIDDRVKPRIERITASESMLMYELERS